MNKIFILPLAVAVACSLGLGQPAPTNRPGGGKISEAQAKSAAVDRVRGDLAAGKLAAWGGGTGGGIRPASVAASRTLFNPTGGKDGRAIYVVLVGAQQATGQVRVIVDATSGAIVSSMHRNFDGATPDWWVKGLDAAPARR